MHQLMMYWLIGMEPSFSEDASHREIYDTAISADMLQLSELPQSYPDWDPCSDFWVLDNQIKRLK